MAVCRRRTSLKAMVSQHLGVSVIPWLGHVSASSAFGFDVVALIESKLTTFLQFDKDFSSASN